MGSNPMKEIKWYSLVKTTRYCPAKHPQLGGVYAIQRPWGANTGAVGGFSAAFVKDCDLFRSTLIIREYIRSTRRTVASLALHFANNMKYSGMRLGGRLGGGSIPSRGKTVAWTVASTKKSEVKAAKVEVVKNFIVETREL